MKITVVHGDTQVQISGAKSLKKAKSAVKDIFKSLPSVEVEENGEPNPIGFSVTASVERADPPEPEYMFTDDEESY
jgi:TATA-box binding protein (TBP) (component of TFIID and TFIIIB)